MARSIIAMALLAAVLLPLPAHAQMENPQVAFKTSMGTIVVDLDPKAAPKTVENFLTYVRNGFYNDTIFHRVIKGFMIQGGGLSEKMQKKKAREPISNEADNGLKNAVGTIAMARTGNPHSATAQFFINVADNNFLNHKAKTQRGWGYCVFGKVSKGLDVVRKIESVKTSVQAGRRDVPVKPVVIQQATVLKAEKKEK